MADGREKSRPRPTPICTTAEGERKAPFFPPQPTTKQRERGYISHPKAVVERQEKTRFSASIPPVFSTQTRNKKESEDAFPHPKTAVENPKNATKSHGKINPQSRINPPLKVVRSAAKDGPKTTPKALPRPRQERRQNRHKSKLIFTFCTQNTTPC